MAEREIYMKYYDENDKEIIIPDDVLNNEVGHGYCATIYRYRTATHSMTSAS